MDDDCDAHRIQVHPLAVPCNDHVLSESQTRVIANGRFIDSFLVLSRMVNHAFLGHTMTWAMSSCIRLYPSTLQNTEENDQTNLEDEDKDSADKISEHTIVCSDFISSCLNCVHIYTYYSSRSHVLDWIHHGSSGNSRIVPSIHRLSHGYISSMTLKHISRDISMHPHLRYPLVMTNLAVEYHHF